MPKIAIRPFVLVALATGSILTCAYAGVLQPVQYHITLPPQPSAGPARSFYAQSAKSVLATLAKRYHLRLEWHGGNFRLPGPVTLLLDSHLHQDVSLLQAALGPYAPLKIVYYAKSRELVVRHALSPQYLAFAQRPVTPPPPESGWDKFLAFFGVSPKTRTAPSSVVSTAATPPSIAKTPHQAPMLANAPVVQLHNPSGLTAHEKTKSLPQAQGTAVPAPVPAQTAVVASASVCTLSLPIQQGERLSTSLLVFLLAHHFSLNWKVPYDLRSQSKGLVQGKNVAAVLQQVLHAVGLKFTLNKAAHTVTITPAMPVASATHVD